MKISARLLVAFALLVAIASAGSAADKRKKKERENHATLIKTVTPTSISIKEGDAPTRDVLITPATEVYVHGKKADLAALQPGMAVSITLAMDGTKASRINAVEAPVLREIKDRKRKKRD